MRFAAIADVHGNCLALAGSGAGRHLSYAGLTRVSINLRKQLFKRDG
jgi:hypothetical protein